MGTRLIFDSLLNAFRRIDRRRVVYAGAKTLLWLENATRTRMWAVIRQIF